MRKPSDAMDKGNTKVALRLYKTAAKMLSAVRDGASLRDMVFKAKHIHKKAVYALVCNSVRNDSLLNHIISKSGLLNEDINVDMAKILLTELLWGKKTFKSAFKPSVTIMAYLPKIQEAMKQSSISVTPPPVQGPRFARINTLKTTVDRAVKKLKGDGWKILAPSRSYEEFKNCIQNLEEKELVKDFHLEDVLVFNPRAALFEHEMIKEGELVLQDKSSCLPPLLLNPTPGSTVLDMCAAPGMKTAHLAALMHNEGCLYAVDRDKDRFKVLQSQIIKFCCDDTCVQPLLKDSISLTDDDCPDVKYILVDPSCTGTGMKKRTEDKGNTTAGISAMRLRKLTKFQEMLLFRAMTAFPNVERIVYSTCSELEEENEQIIEKAITQVSGFRVAPPPPRLKNWRRRGNSKYGCGENCLVASREDDLTNGFFVATLERISGVDVKVKSHNTPMRENRTSDFMDNSSAEDDVNLSSPVTPGKKQKRKSNIQNNSPGVSVSAATPGKKQKRKSNMQNTSAGVAVSAATPGKKQKRNSNIQNDSVDVSVSAATPGKKQKRKSNTQKTPAGVSVSEETPSKKQKRISNIQNDSDTDEEEAVTVSPATPGKKQKRKSNILNNSAGMSVSATTPGKKQERKSNIPNDSDEEEAVSVSPATPGKKQKRKSNILNNSAGVSVNATTPGKKQKRKSNILNNSGKQNNNTSLNSIGTPGKKQNRKSNILNKSPTGDKLSTSTTPLSAKKRKSKINETN